MVSFVSAKAMSLKKKSHLFSLLDFSGPYNHLKFYFSKSWHFCILTLDIFTLAFAHFSGFSLIPPVPLCPCTRARTHTHCLLICDAEWIAVVTMERISTRDSCLWKRAPSWTLPGVVTWMPLPFWKEDPRLLAVGLPSCPYQTLCAFRGPEAYSLMN